MDAAVYVTLLDAKVFGALSNTAVDEVRDDASEGLSFLFFKMLCQVSRDGKEDCG